MPGHVRASINWNTLKRMNGDKYSQEIVDGMKVIVCKLKGNPLGYTSVAYPTDELRIPDWFKELPFDDDAMEATIIDNKLDNLIGVLDYDLDSTKQNNTFNSLFDFGWYMSEEQKLILISEFLEQKLRKEQELEFYIKELEELQRKIGYLKQEVNLTNTIINMIKTEQVYDIKENLLEKDKVIKLPERDKDVEKWLQSRSKSNSCWST